MQPAVHSTRYTSEETLRKRAGTLCGLIVTFAEVGLTVVLNDPRWIDSYGF